VEEIKQDIAQRRASVVAALALLTVTDNPPAPMRRCSRSLSRIAF